MKALADWSAWRCGSASAQLFIVIVAFAARAHAFFVTSLDWDEGLYLVMAQSWLAGGLPYIAVWDQHPPGLPALLAGVQVLIADPVIGARLAATTAVVMTALLLYRFSWRYLYRPGAGLLGAVLYIFCISRWAGLAANTEVFNNAVVTFAAYLLYGATLQDRNGLFKAIVAAAVLGMGLQIKYVVVSEAVLLCLGYLAALYQQRRDLRFISLAAGLLIVVGCLPTGAVILYFWAHGALQPFLEANVGANVAYVSVVPGLSKIVQNTLSGIAPIVGCLLVIGFVLVRCIRWRRALFTTLTPEIWILLWTVASTINVCLPVKFHTHYYFALYPPVCLAAAIALSIATQKRLRQIVAGLTILFATAAPLWIRGEAQGAVGAEADAPRAVAEFLSRAGARDKKLFVYDYDPVVYALAGVRPPTPYALSSELVEFSYSSRVDGVAEVRRVMDSVPDFVVVHVRLPGIFVPVALDELMARRLLNYHIVFRTRNGMDGSWVSIYQSAPATHWVDPGEAASDRHRQRQIDLDQTPSRQESRLPT